MTLFISDKKEIVESAEGMEREARWFMAAAAFCALFGGIYEIFSHQVYSLFMIFAFAIPLLPGALLYLAIALMAKRKARNAETAYVEDESADLRNGFCFPGRIARNAWNSGLAALTVGCIFQGILEIYGTTNKMIAVYPVAAAVLLCFGFAAYLIPLLTLKRLRRYI